MRELAEHLLSIKGLKVSIEKTQHVPQTGTRAERIGNTKIETAIFLRPPLLSKEQARRSLNLAIHLLKAHGIPFEFPSRKIGLLVQTAQRDVEKTPELLLADALGEAGVKPKWLRSEDSKLAAIARKDPWNKTS